MKKSVSALIVLCTIIGGAISLPAVAAEASGNVTLASDYRFRGISQVDRSPAIQGGLDLTYDSGFYLGAWASNVTFSGAAIETDVYAGFGASIDETTSYDVGVIYYAYPEDDAADLDGLGNRDLDYLEVYASVSFRDATVGLAYSPDYFYQTDSFVYVYGDYSFALGDAWSLDFHYGLNMFDNEDVGADFGIGQCSAFDAGGECSNGSEDQYSDWSVGVSTSAAGLDFALQYIDTDLDEEDCFGGSKLCDSTAVFSVSKSL